MVLGTLLAACDSSTTASIVSLASIDSTSSSTTKAAPYSLKVLPAAVSTSTAPKVNGYATAGDKVDLYGSTLCTGSILKTSTAATDGSFSFSVATLMTDGSYNYSVKATHKDGTTECSATFVRYTLDRAGPVITSYPTSTTASTVPSSFSFTLADSYSSIAALSSDNSGGEFLVSGCTGNGGGVSSQPIISISGSSPRYTATLSGGNCLDGDNLQVTLRPNYLKDSLGNAGLSSNSKTVVYALTLTAPSISLTRHDGLTTPIRSATSLVYDISFNNVSGGSTTLVNDATNALGKFTYYGTYTGSAGCHFAVAMNSGVSGGTLTVTGCTGNGNLNIAVSNSQVKNALGIAGTGNSTLVVVVDNQGPVLNQSLQLSSAFVASTSGANSFAFTLTEQNGVVPLSSNNSGNEFVVTGNCSVLPTAATALSGLVYTVTLSGGTCSDGNTVNVAFDITKVSDTVGNPGVTNAMTSNVSYTIDLPAILQADSGGDDVSPVNAGVFTRSTATNLIAIFNKDLTSGNAVLRCAADSSSPLFPMAIVTPTFGVGDGTVSWSMADIVAANDVNTAGLFYQNQYCELDISGLQDANGIRVDGLSSGTPVVTHFSINP